MIYYREEVKIMAKKGQREKRKSITVEEWEVIKNNDRMLDDLIKDNMGLVHDLAYKYRNSLYNDDYDYVVSICLEAMTKAISKFNPSKGRFSTLFYRIAQCDLNKLHQRQKKFGYIEDYVEITNSRNISENDNMKEAFRDKLIGTSSIADLPIDVVLDTKLKLIHQKIESLEDRHRKVILNFIDDPDAPQRVIADRCGLSQVQVSRIIGRFKMEVSQEII